MKRIRNLSKNDFIVVILAVFISWPCCNGFRIELEKSCHALDSIAFVATSHVIGAARGENTQTSPLRILKTSLVVFDFHTLFKFRKDNFTHQANPDSRSKNLTPASKELLFSKLLI